MSTALLISAPAPRALSSTALMSSNPLRRLAISPAGSESPSRLVMMPTMSSTFPLSVAFGSIRVTSSCSAVRPNDATLSTVVLLRSSSAAGTPNTCGLVITRKPTG